MVDYAPYPATMAHDFELYSNSHEQQLDYQHTHPFLPSSSYPMEQTYSAPFNPMPSLADNTISQDLQYHYDAIAQGMKLESYQYQTPIGSPLSSAHSFQEQPPILTASSESGASVSSSTVGSPLQVSQFNEPWNPLGLDLAPSFEYPGMIPSEKTFVGESFDLSNSTSSQIGADDASIRSKSHSAIHVCPTKPFLSRANRIFPSGGTAAFTCTFSHLVYEPASWLGTHQKGQCQPISPHCTIPSLPTIQHSTSGIR